MYSIITMNDVETMVGETAQLYSWFDMTVETLIDFLVLKLYASVVRRLIKQDSYSATLFLIGCIHVSAISQLATRIAGEK